MRVVEQRPMKPTAMSFIRLDDREYVFTRVSLRFEGEDWFATLVRDTGATLELAGEVEGDRLRLDLRALDEVLGALRGAPITTYPGGQSVCAAHLESTPAEVGETVFQSEFAIDWDRALDPAGVTYTSPRVVTIYLVPHG
jgi:hypothetical protein